MPSPRPKYRTLWYTSLAFGFFLLVAWSVQRWLVYPRFVALEKDWAAFQMSRNEAFLESSLDRLQTLGRDWAFWDDLAEFMEGHRPEFPAEFLVPTVFEEGRLHLLGAVHPDGRISFAEFFQDGRQTGRLLEDWMGEELTGTWRALLPSGLSRSAVRGLVSTARGPMLVVANPILTTTGEGPPRGTLLIGQFLDEPLQRDLSRSSGLDLQWHAADRFAVPASAVPHVGSATPRPIHLTGEGPDRLRVHQVFLDVAGQPAVVAETVLSRPIIESGLRVTRQAFAVLVMAGLLSLALLLAARYGSAARVARTGVKSWWNTKLAGVALSAMLGIFLSVAVALGLRRFEIERRALDIERMADPRAVLIQKEFATLLGTLEALRGFFEGSAEVREDEFQQFLASVSAVRREGLELGWRPADPSRPGWSSRPSRAVEPLDPAWFPVWGAAGEAAPLHWRAWRESAPPGQPHPERWLLALALRPGAVPRDSPPAGWVYLVFDPAGLIEQALHGLQPVAIDFSLAGPSAAGEVPSGSREWRFLAGGQFWRVAAQAHPESTADFLLGPAWILLLAGLLLTFLLVLYLRALARAHEEVETLAHTRLQELQRNREWLDLASQAVDLCLWDYDLVADTVQFNQRFYRILGLTPGLLPAGTEAWRHLTHPEDWTRLAEGLARLRDGRATQLSLEHRFRQADGSWRWFLTVGRVVAHEAGGRPARAAGTHLDISERKEAELALQEAKDTADEASRSKGEFLSMMSHEIRTPLTSIIGMASLLSKIALPPAQREYAQTIIRSGDILLGLINEILDYSKLEAGRLELHSAPFNLAELLVGVLDLVASRAAEKRLALHWQVDPAIPASFIGDEKLIRQVLLNLLHNAVKFTESGHVTLRVAPAPRDSGIPELLLSVEDSGIGMEPEVLERLFQPFIQAGPGIARRYGGTGLGLAISKRLADCMGGRIEVRSEPGQGSTFAVSLPLQPDPGAPPVFTDLRLPPLVGRVVGLIDPDPLDRAHTGQLLEALGCRVSVFATLPAAPPQPSLEVVLADVSVDWPTLRIATERWARDSGRAALPLLALVDPAWHGSAPGSVRRLAKPVRPLPLREALLHLWTGHTQGTPPPFAPVEPSDLRVLVVEDNPVSQRVLALMLEKVGCSPELASSGEEALRAVEAIRFDLVLLDVQLPDLDGLEVVRTIRARYPGPERPRLVAVTANALPDDRQKCLAAGFDDYLPKPCTVDDLARIVRASEVPPRQVT